MGRASQKTVLKMRHPDQAWLFNEPEVLAQPTSCVLVNVMISTHEHGKNGFKRVCATPPRVKGNG